MAWSATSARRRAAPQTHQGAVESGAQYPGARWVPCGYMYVYDMPDGYMYGYVQTGLSYPIQSVMFRAWRAWSGRVGCQIGQIGQSVRSIGQSVRSFSYGNLTTLEFCALRNSGVSGLGSRKTKGFLDALRMSLMYMSEWVSKRHFG